MFQFNNYIKYICVIYLIISVSIFLYKPSIVFKNGKIKQFGVGKNKTILYYPVLNIYLSIIIYLIIYSIFTSNN